VAMGVTARIWDSTHQIAWIYLSNSPESPGGATETAAMGGVRSPRWGSAEGKGRGPVFLGLTRNLRRSAPGSNGVRGRPSMMGSSSATPSRSNRELHPGPAGALLSGGMLQGAMLGPNPEGWAHHRSSLWFGDVAGCGDGSRPDSQSLLAALAGEMAIGITTTRGGGDAASPSRPRLRACPSR
jgi:hypothetical protein